jgi:hypothetical protein
MGVTQGRSKLNAAGLSKPSLLDSPIFFSAIVFGISAGETGFNVMFTGQ